jgi:hypothetical protein
MGIALRVLAAVVCAAALGLAAAGMARATAGPVTADVGEELVWRLPIEQKLERPVSFSFQETPLEDVIGFLRLTVGVNIILDSSVVAEDQRLISLTVKDMRAADALNWVCTMSRLAWGYRSGAIYVSTRQQVHAAEAKHLKNYDVRDLLNTRVGRGTGSSAGTDGEGGDGTTTGSTARSTRSAAWLVQVILDFTGRENWRTVAVVGGGANQDETTSGADGF